MEKHRHLIEQARLEREDSEDSKIRLEILNGIIHLASTLSEDRSTQLCYEDVCTLIVEMA